MNKRTVHSPEFMAMVALEAIHGMTTIRKIAQKYGVRPDQVMHWKKAVLEQAKTLFASKRGPVPAETRRMLCLANSEFSKLDSDLAKLKTEVLNIPAAVRRRWVDRTSDVPFSRQCALAGVSRSTVYAQQKKDSSNSATDPE